MKHRIQKIFESYGYFRVNVLAVILAVVILLGIAYVWEDAELYNQTMNLREDFGERKKVSEIYGYEIEEKDELNYKNTVEANLIALEEGTELGRILAENDRNNEEGRIANDFILGGISALLWGMIFIILFNAGFLILNIVMYFSRPKYYEEDEDEYEDEYDSESEEIIEEDYVVVENDENEDGRKEVEIKIVKTLDDFIEEVIEGEEDNEDVDEDEFEEEEEIEFQEIGYSKKDASTKKSFFGCTRLFGGRSTKKVSEEE